MLPHAVIGNMCIFACSFLEQFPSASDVSLCRRCKSYILFWSTCSFSCDKARLYRNIYSQAFLYNSYTGIVYCPSLKDLSLCNCYIASKNPVLLVCISTPLQTQSERLKSFAIERTHFWQEPWNTVDHGNVVCPRVKKLSFAHFAQGLNLHELMSSCIGWCCGAVQGIGELLVKPISVRIEPSHCRALVVYLCPHFVHLVTRVERSLSQHQQKYWYFSWQQMALPSVSVSFPVLTKNHLKIFAQAVHQQKGLLFSAAIILMAICKVIFKSKLFVWYFVFIV